MPYNRQQKTRKCACGSSRPAERSWAAQPPAGTTIRLDGAVTSVAGMRHAGDRTWNAPMNADTLDLMLQRDLPSAAAGCQQAYGRIVLACQNTVTAIALAITRDIAASEDIAQEAFLRAWQRLAQLHQPASFLPCLRQITRNLARDWLRANRHRALSGEAAELAIAMAADPAPSPADQLLQVEEKIAALDIISALPEESRETLLLYYREGQSSQQVGLAAWAQRCSSTQAPVARTCQRARCWLPGSAHTGPTGTCCASHRPPARQWRSVGSCTSPR
ncbi:sigma-70 family RNA polymerase sigma factor (plasmid) [Xanthomonas axonopodis pv. vasculorum]